MKNYDVVIVGGGLAGLTAALHLTQNKLEVLVIEKHSYPRHKVCGEYLSNEIKPYLQKLGIVLEGAVEINSLLLSTAKGTSLKTPLPLGGMGISRYALDNALYLRAIESKVQFAFETVKSVRFQGNSFTVSTANDSKYIAKIVIGAYGKRSALDKQLNRDFIKNRSPWIGVKAHYQYKEFPENLVALHHFQGGYGGLSKTESGATNFCYLVNYKSFELYKDINHFNEQVVAQNPFLKEFLASASPLFDTPMTIAQISFEKKQSVHEHILMCGDSAGLIHPLCGNGMAMAIHSAKIASELILKFFNSQEYNRAQLERDYSGTWKHTFGKRLKAGRRLQGALMHPILAKSLIRLAIKSPRMIQQIIARTHGKALNN